MLEITPTLSIKLAECKIAFIRAPGPGGQNVNKVATGVQLRFNVTASNSLPDEVRERLILQLGNKLTSSGDLIIKAIRYRTQNRNKQDALHRLAILIKKAIVPPKKRKKTKPSLSSIHRRLAKKQRNSKQKVLRNKPSRLDD